MKTKKFKINGKKKETKIINYNNNNLSYLC